MSFKEVRTAARDRSIASAYLNGTSCAELGRLHGLTRQGIYYALRRQKVSLSRARRDRVWIDRRCAECGKAIRVRSRGAGKRSFCGQSCYMKTRSNPSYKQDRGGQKRARRIVSRYWQLDPGQVVHHVDGDPSHNSLSNLWVFASQGEHMSWHHMGEEGEARPIWRGDRDERALQDCAEGGEERATACRDLRAASGSSGRRRRRMRRDPQRACAAEGCSGFIRELKPYWNEDRRRFCSTGCYREWRASF